MDSTNNILPGCEHGGGGFFGYQYSRVADCRNETVVEEEADVPEYAIVLLEGGLDEAVDEHHRLRAEGVEVVEDEELSLHLDDIVEGIGILGDGKEILQGGRVLLLGLRILEAAS